ncbi:MAG: hypothetical protein ACFFCE_11040 [Promethearchaeota archaeon]
MYKIEKIGETHLYVKALGTFPPSVAERFIEEFEERTKDFKSISVIVDGLDLILLNLKSFEMILDLLKRNNDRLVKSAYIISKNLVLKKEAEILFERADSPKRKIVENLEEAREWLGIPAVIIERD